VARVNHEMVVERIARMKMVPKRVSFKFAPDEGTWWFVRRACYDEIVIAGKDFDTPGDRLIKELIKKEFGYCNDLLFFLFNIFHEIGHYYALEKGICNSPDEENLMKFYLSAASHSPERIHQIEKWYRELPIEAYCDRYAIKQIKKLFKKERRRIRWS
jgi:hypothetical protein